jgi:hypothetical protein
MAVTTHVFTQFIDAMGGDKQIALDSDPLRVILLTAATTGLAAIWDTATTMTDIKAATGFTEVATAAGGSNYTQNANSHLSGLALVAPTWASSGHVLTLTTTTNPTWTTAAAAFAPAYAVWFDDVGTTDATNFPICYWDLGGAQPGTGGNWQLTINAAGIFTGTGS